jgi:TetR/AcrR family transcriptional regulator
MPQDTFFNLPIEKRRAIEDVLLHEFAENDYRSVSISRIVAQAGIAKGSFYQYFENKQDCYLYLLQLGMDEKMAFMSQSPPPGEEMDLFDTLRWLLDAGINFEFSNPRLAKIGYRAVFDDVPLPEESMQLLRSSGSEYFRQQIRHGIQRGSIKPDIDPDLAAFIFNIIFTNLGQYLMERLDISADQLLANGTHSFDQAPARKAMNQVIKILEDGLRMQSDETTENIR